MGMKPIIHMFLLKPSGDHVVPNQQRQKKKEYEGLSHLFIIDKHSLLIVTIRIVAEMREELSLYQTDWAMYSRILLNAGYFLLKRFRFAENDVKQQIVDQVMFGMFNPSYNLSRIEEQYGKFVHYEKIQEHPNIIKLFGFVTSSENISPQIDIFGVIMEYPPQGTLLEYVKKVAVSDSQILIWCYQLATALQYIHTVHNIVHGNILPNSPWELRHSPPEVLLREEAYVEQKTELKFNQASYCCSSDIWSLCLAVLYYASHVKIAFEDVPDDKLFDLRKIIEGENRTDGKRPILKEGLDPTLKRLIEACWRTERRDPSDEIFPLEQRRPTAKEILNFLDYN